MDEPTEAFLRRIRKTVKRSGDLIEVAQLRLAETDRLFAQRGIKREMVSADSVKEAEKWRTQPWIPSASSQEAIEQRQHQQRQLRRLMKTVRL